MVYRQLRQVYKYAFYRVCKDAATPAAAAVAHGNASSRHVTISLRANQLDSQVVYQMMAYCLRLLLLDLILFPRYGGWEGRPRNNRFCAEWDAQPQYQMMVMFWQQRRGAGGGGRGCWMSVDLRDNRITHLLPDNAASALTRDGQPPHCIPLAQQRSILDL